LICPCQSTQGCALGFHMVPFQGERKGTLDSNSSTPKQVAGKSTGSGLLSLLTVLTKSVVSARRQRRLIRIASRNLFLPLAAQTLYEAGCLIDPIGVAGHVVELAGGDWSIEDYV
jgi:hypothetical protein